MDVYGERTMGYLSLHVNCNIHNGIYVVFTVLVDINKPDSLLLENQKSKTSSKGHNQTTFLFFELDSNQVGECCIPLSSVFSFFEIYVLKFVYTQFNT